MIRATIHFLDGQVLEKEIAQYDPAMHVSDSRDSVRIWLEHTPWIEMPDNTFLPASRIAKVVWVEVPKEDL